MRRITTVALAATGTLLATTGTAGAATTMGSTLAGSPTATCSGICTIHEGARPTGDGLLTAPHDGVVVRWRFRAGAPSPAARLRILTVDSSTATSTASSAAQPLVAGVNSFATRLPVQAGQRLGITGNDLFVLNTAALAPFTVKVRQSDPVDGAPYAANITISPTELLVGADLEPDVDQDGFGDETQDTCATVANPTQADLDGDGKGDACDSVDDRPCAVRGPGGLLSKPLGGLSRPVGCLVEGLGL